MIQKYRLDVNVRILILFIGFSANCFGNDSASVKEISWSHGKYGQDHIILKGKVESDLPYYREIQIKNNEKIVFNLKEKNFEIEGYEGKVCTQFMLSFEEYYYIFRNSDRPSPDKFIVISVIKGKPQLLGSTDNNTAEIFGDIDYDGFFEIGGFTDWYEGSSLNEKPGNEFFEKNYKVIEVRKGFPKDEKSTEYFLEVLNSKRQK